MSDESKMNLSYFVQIPSSGAFIDASKIEMITRASANNQPSKQYMVVQFMSGNRFLGDPKSPDEVSKEIDLILDRIGYNGF